MSFHSAPIQGPTAPGTLPFDFDCDRYETGETPVLHCEGLCLASPSGYQATVPCGQSAPIGHCEKTPSCVWKADSPTMNKVQRCK